MALLDELRARRTEILTMASACGLTDVRVFGSVARGEENPESDIDLLVNVQHADDPLAFVDFQEAMAERFARNIDIVFERGLYPMLREIILREAKLL